MKQEVRRGRKFVEYHDPETQDEFTFTQEISGADVSYQDETGAWHPADENWETDGADRFILKNEKLNHKVRLKGTGGRTWYPRRNVNTEYITFGVPQYRNGNKWSKFSFSGWSVEGKTITLQTRQGVTILVHNRWNGIKIDWVLALSTAPSRMRYPVSLTGITYVDGIIYGADGTRLGQLTPTSATDSTFDEMGLPTQLPCSGSYSGGYVEFQADVTGAVYPVTIDPDFSVQPDGDAGKDTYLLSALSGTYNFGVTTYLSFGNNATGTENVRRSLIQFDLSSIPSSATVSASALTLYNYGVDESSNNRQSQVYRVLREWVEGTRNAANDSPATGATWFRYDTSNNWGTAGCANTTSDREATSIGAATWTNGEAAGVSHKYTLTASKVQEWIAGTLANNGMLIQNDTENTDTFYACSSDHATAGYRPKMTVTYTAAGGFHPINMTAQMQSLTGGMRS